MTPQQLKAMKLALEALEGMQNAVYNISGEHVIDLNYAIEQADVAEQAITAIKEALAQPKQEPVAWMDADGNVSDNNDHKCFPIPLYTKEQP